MIALSKRKKCRNFFYFYFRCLQNQLMTSFVNTLNPMYLHMRLIEYSTVKISALILMYLAADLLIHLYHIEYI